MPTGRLCLRPCVNGAPQRAEDKRGERLSGEKQTPSSSHSQAAPLPAAIGLVGSCSKDIFCLVDKGCGLQKPITYWKVTLSYSKRPFYVFFHRLQRVGELSDQPFKHASWSAAAQRVRRSADYSSVQRGLARVT